MNSLFLSTVNPWFSLLALLLIAAGVGLLYRAWLQPKRHWPLIAAGWGVLILAHWPWFAAFGVDRGWALAAMLPGLIALLLIALRTPWHERQLADRRSDKSARPAQPSPPWYSQVPGLLVQILVTGLLSLSAALGVALVVYALLDTSLVNRMMAAASVALLLWPVLIVWSRSRDSLVKPAFWFIGLSVAGWLSTPAIF
ncbi:hypothetical protein [Cellvibrio sp. OA-2007]|uniref:hypothetical protein n=1 Tax=Cellvibrio sp. OA-2007 TaxID=529823 RepID=UPI000783287E|nr:hypothetical protein [Cellvibrio sp. OA-2007]